MVVLALLAVLAAGAGVTHALPEREKAKSRSAAPTPLEQAREESGLKERPRTRFELPEADLRLSPAEVVASSGQELTFTVTLSEALQDGTLELSLPRQWVERSGVSGLPNARVPSTGRGAAGRASARRSDRVVRFAFDGAQGGDSASFSLTDLGISAGTYRLPYRWSGRGGAVKRGSVAIVFYAPVREAQWEPPAWMRLASPGIEMNATNDADTESETFMTVVPGNKNRFVVGANGGGAYGAWITNDGGQTFTHSAMPAATDAPGEVGPETSNLCCDPISAADAAGNLWYGGLSQANGAGNPSRIVVVRAAPGATTFQSQTVGLPVRTAGTQDKPMMTIDNSPTSPTFGRLYIVWNEPSGGGINIVISQCDTRPGGVLNVANCDNADNWSTPVSVTPATGSYIYADVAVSPGG
ncbi:MAG: hypothetical protein ACRDKY_10830, partial [Solirubrobacteraceae bacterium]